MRVSMSLLFLIGVIIVLMMRTRHKGDGLTIFEFLLCTAFGFLLASSSFAPTMSNLLQAFGSTIGR